MANPEAQIDLALKSLSELAPGSNAVIHTKDSSDVHMPKVVNNVLYGLLKQETLSSMQVTLVVALLEYSSKHPETYEFQKI